MNKSKIFLLAVLLATLPSMGKRHKRNFVYREHTTLMLNHKPYRAAGVNMFTLTGCGHPWEVFSSQQMDSLFALFPRDFLIRTWAFPGNDTQTDGVVAMARKHHLRLIVSLGDGRSSCGHFDGAPHGDNSGKVPEWYVTGYTEQFLPHVVHTVSKYRNDPTIAMWEVLNEPGEATPEALCAFIDTVAHVIKQHDPNHLITVGCFGPWAYGGAKGYQRMFASQYVDVGQMHEYDYDYKQSNMIESPHFASAMALMRELDKPLIIGETGIESGALPCRTSPAKRAEAMRQKFDVYLQGGASAVLVWNMVNDTHVNGFSFPITDVLLRTILEYRKP